LHPDTQMATDLLVSIVAMALGTFVAASPHRAAKIWGSQRLANLAPGRRASFVRWYRVFGILLCLAGVLLAVEGIVFSNYQHWNFHLRSTQKNTDASARLGETGMRSTGPKRWPSSNSWIVGESAAISSTIPETAR